MRFEEFQHLARLHVLGALEPDEAVCFEAARRCFGDRAEAFLCECRDLAAVFALSLQPVPPQLWTKARLLEKIRQAAKKHVALSEEAGLVLGS